MDPENHIYYSNRSAAYLKVGDWARAFQDAEKCLALDPNFVKGYGRKATVLHTLRRFDEAIAVYEQGLEVAKAQSDEANAKVLKEGLDHAKRAKQFQGHEAVKAVRVARASNAASLSQKRQARSASSVGLFVQHSRIHLQMKIQALQAQLDLINSLARLSDEEKMDMLFHLIDQDRDGHIDARELSKSLRQRHADMTFAESVDQAIELMAVFDNDGDAKLNRNEFKVLIDHMMARLGTSFHDLAEFLVLQLILPTAESPEQFAEDLAGELLAEEMDQQVLARQALFSAVTNPRMKSLFQLFDKDGDGKVNFQEVALGLYQISRDMEGSLKTAMDILLAMDQNDTRVLDYEQFTRLILSMVATIPGQSLDEVADELTLQLTQPTPISLDDLQALVMADDVYEQCKDIIEEAKERGDVLSALQYDKTRRLFGLWDTNQDGVIDFQELLLGLRKFEEAVAPRSDSMDESTDRAAAVMIGFDEDANNKLDQSEFARVLVNFAKTLDVDLHEMIDFMCVTSALRDNTDYEKAYASAKSIHSSDQIKALRDMLLAEVDF